MQKSAHTNKTPARPPSFRPDTALDKGQKHEPFLTLLMCSDRRHLARLERADQKR